MGKPDVGVMFRCQWAPEHLPGYAARAEEVGFDELWLVEDCFFGGGVASATVALASTRGISVGLGIVPAVARNPAFTAMEFGALARTYPGRFLPGIGHGVAGWMRQIGEMPESPLTALEETLGAVRKLLSGEEVSVAGRYVTLDGVRLAHPPEVAPPVSSGVRGSKSLALSGRTADGTVLAECSPTEYVAWAKEKIEAGKSEAGRTDDHRLTVYAWCEVDEDAAAARGRMRPVVAETLASGAAGPHVTPMGIADELAGMVGRGGATAVREEMPDRWIDQLAVVGTPEDCAEGISRLGQAGADSVVLVPPLGRPGEELDVIARKLSPILR